MWFELSTLFGSDGHFCFTQRTKIVSYHQTHVLGSYKMFKKGSGDGVVRTEKLTALPHFLSVLGGHFPAEREGDKKRMNDGRKIKVRE